MVCDLCMFYRVVCRVAVWGDMVALEVVARQQMLSGDHPHPPQVVPLLPQLKEPQKEHGADRYRRE